MMRIVFAPEGCDHLESATFWFNLFELDHERTSNIAFALVRWIIKLAICGRPNKPPRLVAF